jgi:hypothetical protein
MLLSDIHETLGKKKEAEDLLRRALATEGLSRRDRYRLAAKLQALVSPFKSK